MLPVIAPSFNFRCLIHNARRLGLHALHCIVCLSLILPNVTGRAEAASPVAAGLIRSHHRARPGHQSAQLAGAELPAPSGTPTAEPVVTAQTETDFQSAPVMFIENVGQFDSRARFQVRGAGGTIFLAPDALWVTLLEPADIAATDFTPGLDSFQTDSAANKQRRGVNLKISFPGSNPHPEMEGFDPLDTTVSYFIGNDPAKWQPDVPVWAGVRYKDLYPEIDLEVTSEKGQWVWRVVAQNSADLTKLQLQVDGADTMQLDRESVILTTAIGEYRLPLLQVPGMSPATIAPKVQPSPVHPKLSGNTISWPFAGFALDESSTASSASNGNLIYSAIIGPGWMSSIAVDASGAAYVTGEASGSSFPITPGAFQTNIYDGGSVFITKVSADGSSLIYSSVFGGSGYEDGGDIAVDAAGAAYVIGTTGSSNFPTTPGAFQTTASGTACTGNQNCYEAFVTKLSASGDSLVYSTYLRGGHKDVGLGIALDPQMSGAVYLTGTTYSSNFPTTVGAFQRLAGGGTCGSSPCGDVFVTKLNATGSGLMYSTYLGGNSDDWGMAVDVDATGAAYITGTGPTIPTTPGAFLTSAGWGAFVTKLNSSGSALVYSTFLGHGRGSGIHVTRSGLVYVTGIAGSTVTPGVFDPTPNGIDGFVAELNADGSDVLFSTYLGGSGTDIAEDIAVDGDSLIYVTGYTISADFPIAGNAYQTSYTGGEDAFLVNSTVVF